MPKIVINDQEIEVPEGVTVLQAAEMLGVEIPVFCYHPRLSIAGNCRMCLVEVEKSPKPVASCAMPVTEGMVVRTHTPMVHEARKGVLEFLLINHPLDCPICDQGGECDLQDITMGYGPSTSRFAENKRAIKDKYFGPLIKTHMTRCIHCTRCIRFADEVAGTPELGATSRGELMEVGTYIEKALTSELSGNMIDICPVGALTSKPYAFKARSWELESTDTIDVFDAVGSNVRVDARGTEVMRVLPRLHEDINEEWLADKARFAIDGLKYQRIDVPYVRRGDRLQPATWEEAFRAIAEKLSTLKGHELAAIIGDQADCEAILCLKEFMASLGCSRIECRQDGAHLPVESRSDYVFNSTIAATEDTDACLLVAANTRWEAPLINARLRKAVMGKGAKVALIGPRLDLGYPYDYLGNTPSLLLDILKETHPFSKILKNSKRGMVILGSGALAHQEGEKIHNLAKNIAEKFHLIQDEWCGFNVLHTAASRVGALDLKCVPAKNSETIYSLLKDASEGRLNFVYLLAADELDIRYLKNTFVVYQGHHGDRGASVADVVLPGAALYRKERNVC